MASLVQFLCQLSLSRAIQMPYASLIVLITCIVSTSIGSVLVYWYFSRMKKLKYYVGLEDVRTNAVEDIHSCMHAQDMYICYLFIG